jgi:hypothetical protein
VLHSGMHWWLLKLWFHTSTICEDFTYTKERKMQVTQASPPLPSPIKRIFYMSSEGTNLLHEVHIQIPCNVCSADFFTRSLIDILCCGFHF